MRALLLAVACAGCTSMRTAEIVPVDLEPPDPLLAAPRCSSGRTRDANESEGPEMMPGHACVSCHAAAAAMSGEADAPLFAFAGTVYPSGHEPDGCLGAGAAGAEVVVRDNHGTTVRAPVNAAGNFFFDEHRLVHPIFAKVVYGGRERAMKEPQDTGDCNACHTGAGDFGAPGRIVLP